MAGEQQQPLTVDATDLRDLELPRATTMDDRVRMNTLALATVTLSQSPCFWHAGADLLRSKSLDRNSYDSGDWFNTLDWTGADNGFGHGLPPKPDNEAKWPFMRPLLADPALEPSPQAIQAARDRAAELRPHLIETVERGIERALEGSVVSA